MIEDLDDIKDEINKINAYLTAIYKIGAPNHPISLLAAHASNDMSALYMDIMELINVEFKND